MRITGGKFRGRVIPVPLGGDIRPTTDRAREAVFNILTHAKWAQDIPALGGARVLDSFCGSGALGFEALSRGAARVCFLDHDGAQLEQIRQTAEDLGAEDAVETLKRDASRPGPAPHPAAGAEIAFLDAPYGKGLAPPALTALGGQGWIANGGLCVVELAAKDGFDPPPGFDVLDERRYGATRFVFLRFDAKGV